MGIEIGAQLDALWRSLFLGAAFALLYDGLRALRLRRRTRRALTDLSTRSTVSSSPPPFSPSRCASGRASCGSICSPSSPSAHT